MVLYPCWKSNIFSRFVPLYAITNVQTSFDSQRSHCFSIKGKGEFSPAPVFLYASCVSVKHADRSSMCLHTLSFYYEESCRRWKQNNRRQCRVRKYIQNFMVHRVCARWESSSCTPLWTKLFTYDFFANACSFCAVVKLGKVCVQPFDMFLLMLLSVYKFDFS